MVGYVTNIEEDTLENEDYRRVLFTGKNLQLVLMTVQPGEEIGLETHEEHDQFIRIEAGTGVALLAGEKHELSDGFIVSHRLSPRAADRAASPPHARTPDGEPAIARRRAAACGAA